VSRRFLGEVIGVKATAAGRLEALTIDVQMGPTRWAARRTTLKHDTNTMTVVSVSARHDDGPCLGRDLDT
jgi:hypothetical protein